MEPKEIRKGVWEFKDPDMPVPARVYASKKLFSSIEEGVFRQASNVSKLPGIQKASLVMPDGHYGYGFPIGGVAAFDPEGGIVSPGGVGYDINCGVRLLSTGLFASDFNKNLKPIISDMFSSVPSGVGSKGNLRLSEAMLDEVAISGAKWAVENGFGVSADLENMEENGCISKADPSHVSKKAKSRGRPQLGTLGAGNHFLEIQTVGEIFDEEVAKKFGITNTGQIMVMVHTGSRGFGHQVADENIGKMLSAARKYGIDLPDRELACAPIGSVEAEEYLSAMRCAVNYAFCNRQVITHFVRESFERIFGGDCSIDLVYDVCHNIAKFEEHYVDGDKKTLCVHRKGATRAFPAGRPEVPEKYIDVGHPVIIPGDMGTASYVLVGTQKALDETWGSTCHGAGRVMSRKQAIKRFGGGDIRKQMESSGKIVQATNPRTLAEEASGAYKDISEVIHSVELSGIAKPVAKMIPLGVIKG